MDTCIRFIWTSILIFIVRILFSLDVAGCRPKFILLSSTQLVSPLLTKLMARSRTECAVLCNSLKQFRVASYDDVTHECSMSDSNYFDAITETQSGSKLIIKQCCPEGYEYDNNTDMHYKTYGFKCNWFKARFICQIDEGDLVSITTIERWNVLVNQAAGYTWIGLKTHRWVNGKSFVDLPGVKSALNDYDGNFPSDKESDCGIMANGASNGGVDIFDSSCNRCVLERLICEIN